MEEGEGGGEGGGGRLYQAWLLLPSNPAQHQCGPVPHFGKSGCCFTSSGKGKMVNRENLRPTFYLGTYRMEKGTSLFCGVPGVETGQWGKYLFSAGLRTV